MKHPFMYRWGWLAVVGIAAAVGWSWRFVGTERASGAEANAASPLSVTSRARTLNDREEGEVVLGDQVVIRVRSAAGGYSATQRADLMAGRMKGLLAQGAGSSDVTTGQLGGEAVVLVQGQLVATADRFHADLNGTTPERLAGTWSGNIRRALAGNTGSAASALPLEEPLGNKIVPILSGGNGLRVGVARVSGPAREVGQVKAVAQLEDEYQNIARVRVWVPVSSEDIVRKISRVGRVSVTGFADVRL